MYLTITSSSSQKNHNPTPAGVTVYDLIYWHYHPGRGINCPTARMPWRETGSLSPELKTITPQEPNFQSPPAVKANHRQHQQSIANTLDAKIINRYIHNIETLSLVFLKTSSMMRWVK